MAPRRPPRGLGPEDLRLWHSVARSARPLHGGDVYAVSPRPSSPAADTQSAPNQRPPQATPGTPLVPCTPSGPKQPVRIDLRPDITERLGQAPLRMDKKRFVAMNRGKAEPEARMDLHGMTLAQAHGALNGFILRAHGAGLRLVLVITGKGMGGGATSMAERPPSRGALRQQVPQWLTMAPLGAVVLQVTPAHRRHGGTGAYYVYLRRPRQI